MALSGRRQRFVEEYLIDGNATAAYRRAGYTASGESARRNASRLLTNADVQAALAEARAQLSSVLSLTREDVARGLRTEATYHGDDASASARVSAWRELGKLLGFYPPEKSEVRFLESDDDAALETHLGRLAAGQTVAGGQAPGDPTGPGEPSGNGRAHG
jgi:phage terminase small subunit